MSQSLDTWTRVTLGEVCEFKYGKSLPEAKRAGGDVPVYGSNGIIGYHNESITDGMTIVVGRKGSFGEINLSSGSCWSIDTTYYIDRTATGADLRWLAYQLEALKLTELNKSAAVPGLNREDAYRKKLLLPPIAEQKRIAAILDKAEELRSLRRKTLAELDAIAQSIFLEMFGDPSMNLKSWKSVRFQDVLKAPLRNGLSPSTSGTVTSKVLTLSAITGSEFCESAVKTSTFQSIPPSHQIVIDSDFLICRGNGNIHLVGKAYFPTCSMPDVVFPDTMIAAQVKEEDLDRAFLQYIWNSNFVRLQIESLARTTNGTFKVNQTMLESVLLLAPPIELQQEFARRVEAIEHLKTAHRQSLTQLDALFASLQHRAFRGDL